ncbi:MAG: helix-turn-helix transcriptional regulator [Candidatus Thiodiazotropha endolucinida]
MDIHDIRRLNVEGLIEEHGSQVKLAELVDTAPAYISQIIAGKRNPGESFCRKIEKHLGLPAWYMDALHEAPEDILVQLNEEAKKLPGTTQIALLNLIVNIQQTHTVLSSEESQLVAFFRECDPGSKKTVLEVASAQARLNENGANK